MKRRAEVALTLALALLVGGCAHGGRRIGTTQAELPARTTPAMVRVTNHNWTTVELFVLANGRSTRLGQLETGGSAVFSLPAAAHWANDFQLFVAPIGGNDSFETGRILISPGRVIELTIENHLPLSSYAVEDQ